jgi:hypothetical protein
MRQLAISLPEQKPCLPVPRTSHKAWQQMANGQLNKDRKFPGLGCHGSKVWNQANMIRARGKG